MPTFSRRAFAAAATAIAVTTVDRRGSFAQASPQASPEVSPALQQIEWALGVINSSGAMPDAAELAAHFSPSFLAAVPASQLSTTLLSLRQQLAPITIVQPTSALLPLGGQVLADTAAGGQIIISIVLDQAPTYLIEGLTFQPAATPGATPVPFPSFSTWDDVYAALSPLAKVTSLYAAEVLPDGSFSDVFQSPQNPSMAIGSAFKLYVLGAIAAAIGDGTASWNDQVEVTDLLKSLPSGITQNELSGTKLSVKTLAERMISISDNTAADMLINFVGRTAVEDQLTALGNSNPAKSIPFLKTRELFLLKIADHQELASKFLNGKERVRRQVLDELAGDPLPDAAAIARWTTPQLIDVIEWFASPTDLATAITKLWALGDQTQLTPIHEILTINPGVPLDAATWKTVAYKGGSEPGVLSVCWRLERADGRVFVIAGAANDPAKALDENAVIAVFPGAIDLLAKV